MKFYLLLVAILAFSTTIDAANFNCYTRADGTSGEGADTVCDDASKKCIAYYDADGKNVGACVATSGACTGKTGCKECVTADCNKRATIFPKCYKRQSTDTAPAEGTKDEACTATLADAKCVSYYDASGNNLGKCLNGGCADASVSSLPCKDCFTDNCNVRSLVTTTTTTTTTAAPGAGATRASVGWLTGIIAASACVLVLMKPF